MVATRCASWPSAPASPLPQISGTIGHIQRDTANAVTSMHQGNDKVSAGWK